jgi:hypothetical protein
MSPSRIPFLALGFAFALAAAGCSSPPPPPNPMPVLGNYNVTIDANGKEDADEMVVFIGSMQNILMRFTFGVLPDIRGTLVGSTDLTIPSQTINVEHATGFAEGVAVGSGTFTSDATMVDYTFKLTTPGYGPSDGGSGLGGSGAVTYHVTGMKQM